LRVVNQHFLFIKNVKHYARNTSAIAICGIRFFYNKRCKETGPPPACCARRAKEAVPVILRKEEMRQILSRRPRYKVCLTTIYSCGLRFAGKN